MGEPLPLRPCTKPARPRKPRWCSGAVSGVLPHRWQQAQLPATRRAHPTAALPTARLLQALPISPPSPSPRGQPHPAHLRDTRALLLSPAPSSPSFPRLWGPALLPAPPSQALRAAAARGTPFSFSFGVSLTAPRRAGSSPWRGARWHAPLHVPKHPASPSYLPAPNLPRRASVGRAAKPFLPSDASPGRRDGGVCSAPSPARRVCTARAQELKPSPSTLLLLHSPWVTPAPPVCHLPSLK